MSRTVVIEVADSGRVFVEFKDDEHFTKREILRIISTIKLESRQQVKRYRRKQRLLVVKEKGASNGRNESRKESVGKETRGDESGSGPVEKSNRAAERSTGSLAAAIDAKRSRRAEEGPRGSSKES